MPQSNSLAAGTIGGTFLSVLPNLTSADLLKTMLLAFVGAVVSYLVSDFLKWLFGKEKK